VQEGHGPARRQAGAFGARVVQVHFIPHVLYRFLSLSKDYVPPYVLYVIQKLRRRQATLGFLHPIWQSKHPIRLNHTDGWGRPLF